MSTLLSDGCAAVGMNPLAHMAFVIRAPHRVVALRLALSRVIHPRTIVLDAGCGALGLLAIMAARLGAARVIAVDHGDLSLARRLAEENGVSRTIEFVQGDLEAIALGIDRVDVIVAMIYNNDPQLDRPQQHLMQRLIDRYAHDGSVTIPNKVRYWLTGYDAPGFDRQDARLRHEWKTQIANAERYADLSFSAVRSLLDDEAALPPLAAITPGRRSRPPLGVFDRTGMNVLTDRTLFSDVSYRRGGDPTTYPDAVALPIAYPGRFNTVVWQQDLIFDDILLRGSESVTRVTPPRFVEPGMTAVLTTGAWNGAISMTIPPD
jgi:SAM-dependent methyltransferase